MDTGKVPALTARSLPWGIAENEKQAAGDPADLRIPAPDTRNEGWPVQAESERKTRRWLRWLATPVGLAYWAALSLRRPPSETDQDEGGHALAGAGMAGILWPRSLHGLTRLTTLVAAVFALTTVVGLLRRSRIRAARHSAILDAYADRELARVRGLGRTSTLGPTQAVTRG
jgi:hypothetical protein